MNKYLQLFFSGAVASLPSIIAACGIVINNHRASLRQKRDRNIKLELDIIEDIYEKYDVIRKEYIDIMSSTRTNTTRIMQELLYSGQETFKQEYDAKLEEMLKNALFLSVYKRKILEACNIEIDAD